MSKRGESLLARRLEPIWLWVEPLAALVVALILYFPLKRPDLADLTGIFGILLTVSAIATTIRLRGELNTVAKLSEVVDLSRDCDVAAITELFRLYISIREPELQPIREDAIHDCIVILGRLAHDKMGPETSSSEYYTWLLSVLGNAPKGSVIRAVSVMAESEWTETPAEIRFLEANIAAAKRGVNIERIFITTRTRLEDPRNRAVIARHVEHDAVGLTAHLVWEDDLSRRDPALVAAAGAGFISFDGRVALRDISVPPAEARGMVTMSDSQLRQMDRVFDKLKLHSAKATPELMQEFKGSSPALGT